MTAVSGRPVLGVDVGGVIIDRANDDSDTSFFSDNYLRTTATSGAFAALRRLVDGHFGSDVHVISKCGPSVEQKTREWLAHHCFFDATGILPGRVHFCRKRRDKAPLCASLGVTHFVDDRLDVLESMTTVRHRFLFLGGGPPDARPQRVPPGVSVTQTWSELLELILGGGAGEGRSGPAGHQGVDGQ